MPFRLKYFLVGLIISLACTACSPSQPHWKIRMDRKNDLSAFETALNIYKQEAGKYPARKEALSSTMPPSDLARCEFIQTQEGLLIYSKDVLRPIREGEEIGPNRYAPAGGIPAGRAILLLGHKPEIIPEAEFQQRYQKNIKNSNN